MTFREYIDKIRVNHSICCIFIKDAPMYPYFEFGFNDEDYLDDTEEEFQDGIITDITYDFVMISCLHSGDSSNVIHIDSAQEIELKENDPCVYVTNRFGDRIGLKITEAITHPTINI